MTVRLLEGETLATTIKKQAINEISMLAFPPRIASILIGNDKGAHSYARVLEKTCEQAGIQFLVHKFPESVLQEDIIQSIVKFNQDEAITGILIFMPLPTRIKREVLLDYVAPEKDIEGITPTNMGKLFYGDHSLAPCTPQAVMLLLKSLKVSLVGKQVVIVSRSTIIGQPLLIMLLKSVNNSPTPTCCHIATPNLEQHTKKADNLEVAAGKAGLVTGEMIKPGAIVIDVGINVIRQANHARIIGDVDAESAKKVASWLTPVPGGVGLVTSALLLRNIATLAKSLSKKFEKTSELGIQKVEVRS